ncbi:hypothetical protein [Porticoccus sp.]|nr:MAG: hypothetical protein EP324_01160 [Gammaproteobacteria bacterium]
MEKLSNEETKRLLDHACSAAQMTATKVADILDVPAPRISEGRNMAWRLNQTQADKLTEKFGRPRGKAGIFIRAERRESIQHFLDNEKPLSEYRHFKRAKAFFDSQEFQNKLADALQLSDESPSLLQSIEKKRQSKTAENRKSRLDILFSIMQTPEFARWLSSAGVYLNRLCDTYDDLNEIYRMMGASTYYAIDDLPNIDPQGSNENLSSENSLDEILRSHSLNIQQLGAMRLFLVGALEQSLRGPTSSNQTAESLTEMHEYVITGQKIWSYTGAFSEPKRGEIGIDNEHLPEIKNGPDWTPLLTGDYSSLLSTHLAPEQKATPLSVDFWTTYEATLFMNDNCDYAFWLSLASDRQLKGEIIHFPTRNIVVPFISGSELFKELEKIRAWLTLPELPLITIKTDIAKHGGYLPGTIVI